MDQIADGSNPEAVANKMTFATAGFSKLFKLWDYTFLTKISWSPVITSTSSGNYINDEEFSGYKYLLFLTYLRDRNWNYSFLYKQHILSGPTNLTITRIGLGFGYRFF